MATKQYDPKQDLLFISTPHNALPEDHLCYFIDEVVEKLDFSSLPDKSATPGNPEYDPRLKTKALLYGYATGIFSSRKLMCACREQLPFMFLTRGQYPDFRTLSDFRKDNLGFLADAFAQVVRIARQMGLARLGAVAVDSTKIRANAAQRTFKDREQLLKLRKKIREELYEGVLADEREDGQFGKNNTGLEMPEGLRKQTERLRRIERALEVLDETGYNKASLTDPESSQMRNHGQVRPHYNCQATVDVESRVIVAADVSRSPADSHELLPQLDQLESNTGQSPIKALADNGYYTVENLTELESKGIEGYVPDSGQAQDAKLLHRGKEPPERPFEKRHFIFDPQTDTYTCPLGHKLVRKTRQESKKYTVYRRKDCRACPRKSECAPKATGRSIVRHDNEASLTRMRSRMDSEEGKRIYRERFKTIEPTFAWMKWATGFGRFRLRGKDGALTEFLLLSIGHNIKQIAKHMRTFSPEDRKRALAQFIIAAVQNATRILNTFTTEKSSPPRRFAKTAPITGVP
jgi:transposase